MPGSSRSQRLLDAAAIESIRQAAERADTAAAEAGALALDLGRHAADLKAHLAEFAPGQVSTLLTLLKRLLGGQADREARLRLLARQFAGLLRTVRGGVALSAQQAGGIAELLARGDIAPSEGYCELAVERRKRMPIARAIETATGEMADTCREIERDNRVLRRELSSVEQLLRGQSSIEDGR